MQMKTKQHFYNEIKEICAEIGRLKLPNEFIKLAKHKNEDKIFIAFRGFKTDHMEMWARMAEFYKIYPKLRRPNIFYGEYTGEGKEEGLFKYDPKEIDPVNLCFLFIFGNGAVNDDDLFKNPLDFKVELEKVNYKLAKFNGEFYLDSLKLLQEAYKE